MHGRLGWAGPASGDRSPGILPQGVQTFRQAAEDGPTAWWCNNNGRLPSQEPAVDLSPAVPS